MKNKYRAITEQDIKNHPLHWISRANGGYSLNIRKDAETGSVLPNCTGFATGMFSLENFLYKGVRDYDAEEKLIYDAANYWWMVTVGGLKGKYKYGKEVKKGGLMVWSGGGSGCGHVCYALEDEHNNKVLTYHSNNSGVGGLYYTEVLSNANGRWSYNSSYKYEGCIYPNIEYDIYTSPQERNTDVDQVEILTENLRLRADANLSAEIYKFAQKGFYQFYETKDCDGYTWYRLDNGDENQEWVAGTPSAVKLHKKKIRKGDKVKIKQGAKGYSGANLKEWVYDIVWEVYEVISPNEIVIQGENQDVQKDTHLLMRYDDLEMLP